MGWIQEKMGEEKSELIYTDNLFGNIYYEGGR